MTRIRYLSASWPLAMTTIGARLKQLQFSAETDEGFLLDRVRDAFVEGRYIEKLEIDEVVRNPFGTEVTYNRIVYREVRFRISNAFPEIEVTDPPRTIRSFINKLSEITGFKTAIEELQVSPFAWVDSIASSRKLPVNFAQIAGLPLDEGVEARIIATGKAGVREAIRKMAGRKPYTVEKAQVLMEASEGFYTVMLSSDASARFSGNAPPEIVDLLRRNLPKPRSTR